MENILNLVWTVLAIAIVWLWVRHAPRENASRWMQFVAMATLLMALFPVISVTDDIQAAQNLAEDVTTLCQDYTTTHIHNFSSGISTVPPTVYAKISICLMCLAVFFHLGVPSVDKPALASIQNRPPPAA